MISAPSSRPTLYKSFKEGQRQFFSKGETIIREFEEPRGVYLVDKGFVKVYGISSEGEENIHTIYGHGDLFPLIWAFRNRTINNVYYKALNDCTIWVMPKSKFIQHLKVNIDISKAVINQITEQYYSYIIRIENLERKKANERVALFIRYLGERFGSKFNKQIIINGPFTHQVISDSINLTRESVSKEFELLKKDGFIKASQGEITIINPEKFDQIYSI